MNRDRWEWNANIALAERAALSVTYTGAGPVPMLRAPAAAHCNAERDAIAARIMRERARRRPDLPA